MSEYHKIQTVFKRDPNTKFKTVIDGDYSLPEFEYLSNNKWIYTEKVDGTNIRVYRNGDGVISFRGKTDNTQIPAQLVNKLNSRFMSRQFDFRDIFGGASVCLYGEGYGARIQKGGGNYRDDQDFVLFDVMVDGWLLRRNDVDDVARKLKVDVVPVIGEGSLHEMICMARNGFSSMWGDFQAEGIVARPSAELRTRSGDRVIAKIKCRDFERT